MSVSRLWADFVVPDLSAPADPDDPYGNEIDRPGATWLTIIDRPLRDSDFREVVHPRTGEVRFELVRPCYHLGSDWTSQDDAGGEILIGDQRGASTIGGSTSNRVPAAPIEGQRLRRNRLGTGKQDVTATRTNYAPPEDGLEGGTAPAPTEAPPGSHLWAVVLPNGREIVVAARTRATAKRAAKAILELPTSDPLPAGTRIRCEG